MKTVQVKRAAVLVEALERIPQWRKLCRKHDRLDIQVEGDHPYVHSFRLDGHTGLRVLASAEDIVRKELVALKVKLPRRKS